MSIETILGDYDFEYDFDNKLRSLRQIRSLVSAVWRIMSSDVQRLNEDKRCLHAKRPRLRVAGPERSHLLGLNEVLAVTKDRKCGIWVCRVLNISHSMNEFAHALVAWQ